MLKLPRLSPSSRATSSAGRRNRAGGIFWHVPSWAKKAGCPIHSASRWASSMRLLCTEPKRHCCLRLMLGEQATGTAVSSAVAMIGTLDWVFAEIWSGSCRYTKLDPKTRRNHESGFKLVGAYLLKDGTRLGTRRVSLIDTSLTDALYEKLLVLTDEVGNVIGERRTTVNHAMKSCRRAWNICSRRNSGKLPRVNPFAQMGLRSSNRETPTATYNELVAFPE